MVFKLSSVLFGHSLDVRALATTADGIIVSTSRDKTARIWKPNGFNSGYTEAAILRGHTNFVSCVCVLPPSPDFREGLILTGGCDKKICAFQLTSFDPMFILEDHKDNDSPIHADNLRMGKLELQNFQLVNSKITKSDVLNFLEK